MRIPHTHFSQFSAIPQFDGLNCSMNVTNSFSSDPNCSSINVRNLTHEESWFSQLESTIRQEENSPPQYIPVHISSRYPKVKPLQTQHSRKKNSNNITIKRDNRLFEALSLPVFSVYNMRSIWSKLSSLAEDMDERNTDLSILSEVWEKKENLKHQSKLEELFEMKDTRYFSTARPGTKRGGGAAITAKGNKFYVSKLNIEIPKPLEIVWGMLRPKIIFGGVSKIIICSFYSPPNSRKKSALIDHMAVTINKLKIFTQRPHIS